jgi:ABC-type polar amino acid transport system ATPase subunit
MDEATTALDPVSAFHVNRVMLGLREKSQTMVLITHQDKLVYLADIHLLLEQGELIRINKP